MKRERKNTQAASLTVALTGLTTATVAAITPFAHAQTASADTRIIATGIGTRIINGVGSDSLRAAFDTHQNGIIGGDASAMAGRGMISTFAVATAQRDTTPFIDSCNIRARASMTDSFSVMLEEPAKGAVSGPKTMHFDVGSSGTVTYSHGTLPPAGVGQNGIARVEYSMSFSSSQGGSGSFSGFMSKGVEAWVENGQWTYRDFDNSGGIWGSIPVDVVVTPGQSCVISISMSSQAFADVTAGSQEGMFTNASADFGHTLRWRGAASIVNADGTPFRGTVSVISPTGFNYVTPADIDGSGSVNAADLSELLAQWGTSNPAADIGQNGVVDAQDLSMLLAAWTN
ncbi:MAG: GC-type dockerin domain-anchored protein [bacterium]